jgi:S1-C subfamily serine protease
MHLPYSRPIWALSVIGVLFLAASTIYARASSLDDIQKGTLMLYNGGDGFCSGTLIAPDLILSAAHCADQGDGVNVRVQTLDDKDDVLSEKLVYVKAVRTLKEWDVALFSPKDSKQNFVQAFGSSVAVIDVASDDEAKTIKLGDRVLAFGYPKAFQLEVTDGLFSG